jgi:hypothetical protein
MTRPDLVTRTPTACFSGVADAQLSLVRVWMTAQDSRGACGLLYFAAVPISGHDQEHRQGQSDVRLGSDQEVVTRAMHF